MELINRMSIQISANQPIIKQVRSESFEDETKKKLLNEHKAESSSEEAKKDNDSSDNSSNGNKGRDPSPKEEPRKSEDSVNNQIKEVKENDLKDQLLKNDDKNDANNSSINEFDENKRIREASQKIESKLIESVNKRENTNKQKLELADSINFKSLPSEIVEVDQYGFLINKNGSDSHDTSNDNKTNNNEKNNLINNEETHEDKSRLTYNQLHSGEVLKLNARIEKWTYMLNNFHTFLTSKYYKLKSRTRKGIPDNLRSLIWPLLMDTPNYFVKNQYEKLLIVPLDSTNETVIIKDLDRTFPLCQFFRDKYGDGQRRLYKVLTNFSKYNKATGYVQGMGFLAALFLTYVNEETAFYCMISLMKNERYDMEKFFLPGFPDLKKVFFIFLNLLKKFLPQVYQSIKKSGLLPSAYASQWFICLFSNDLSFDVLVRVFDTFLLEGYKVIYRYVLAMMKLREKEIIAADGDIVKVMGEVKKVIEISDVEKFIKIAFDYSFSRKDIKKYETEYEKVKFNPQNEFVMQL